MYRPRRDRPLAVQPPHNYPVGNFHLSRDRRKTYQILVPFVWTSRRNKNIKKLENQEKSYKKVSNLAISEQHKKVVPSTTTKITVPRLHPKPLLKHDHF